MTPGRDSWDADGRDDRDDLDGRDGRDEPRPETLRARTLISTTPGEVDERHMHDRQRMRGARRRRWQLIWAFVLLVVALGAGMAIIAVIALDGDDDGAVDEVVVLDTAEVELRDLAVRVDVEADVAFGPPADIVTSAAGTMTSIVAVGDEVSRGGIVGLLDGEPVVAFYGDAPFDRDLEVGAVGDDVEQLEANLAALGFDDGGVLSVDQMYSAATERAVSAWEQTIGLRPSGVVPSGRLVAVRGPLVVTETVGADAQVGVGDRIATGALQRSVTDVVQPGPGTVTGPLAVGTPIVQGTELHLLNGFPVVAVTETSDTISIVLDPLAANDIEALEAALVFFGYDPERVVVVDGVADLATLAAFSRWQAAVGLPETPAIGAQYYLEVPAGRSVDVEHLTDGQILEGGAIAVTVGAPTRSITAAASADVAEDVEVGASARFELADGTMVSGTVIAVDDVATARANTDGPATVTITFELDDESRPLIGGPVTASIEISRIDGAVVVPERAIVTSPDGGSAVEVRRPDGATDLVEVALGVSDAGFVEVVSGDLVTGDEVVVHL
jgi:multidrug efflux pump subunit AcrA (membrane-fusion protein)